MLFVNLSQLPVCEQLLWHQILDYKFIYNRLNLQTVAFKVFLGLLLTTILVLGCWKCHNAIIPLPHHRNLRNNWTFLLCFSMVDVDDFEMEECEHITYKSMFKGLLWSGKE